MLSYKRGRHARRLTKATKNNISSLAVYICIVCLYKNLIGNRFSTKPVCYWDWVKPHFSSVLLSFLSFSLKSTEHFWLLLIIFSMNHCKKDAPAAFFPSSFLQMTGFQPNDLGWFYLKCIFFSDSWMSSSKGLGWKGVRVTWLRLDIRSGRWK